MVAMFDGHNADVVFVGHSMGGLASINYGIDYAENHPNKQVSIITVSTPFSPNFYAGLDKAALNGIFTGWIDNGASSDLAGWHLPFTKSALSKLRTNWINYKGKKGTAQLHTIGIIGSSNNVKDRDNRGDGIINICTQLGADWGNICSQDTIKRDNNNNTKLDAIDKKDPYHHMNTSNLPKVAERINEIVKGDVKCNN